MSIEVLGLSICLIVAAICGTLFLVGWFSDGRISKGDTRCRECGSQMVERSPYATTARRHFLCDVCDHVDSYIDRDRVKKAQEAP